jgi:hypothetical protein
MEVEAAVAQAGVATQGRTIHSPSSRTVAGLKPRMGERSRRNRNFFIRWPSSREVSKDTALTLADLAAAVM